MLLAVHAVRIGVRPELPALPHHGIDRVHRDDVFEALERAEDDGAVCPRTGVANIKVIAPALGFEPATAARPRAAVRRHPVAELGRRTVEAPAACLDVVEAALPHAVDQLSVRHARLLEGLCCSLTACGFEFCRHGALIGSTRPC